MNYIKVYPPIKSFFILFLFFSFNIINAQKEKDTIQAWTYYQKGDSLFKIRDFKNAIFLFEKATHLYEEVEKWERVANNYHRIAECYSGLRIYNKTIEFAKKVLVIDTLNLKNNDYRAFSYWIIAACQQRKTELYEDALVNYKKAINLWKNSSIKNYENLYHTYLKLGSLYRSIFNSDKAINNFKKALEIIPKENMTNNLEKTAMVYILLSDELNAKKEFFSSLEYREKAIKIYINLFGENSFQVGWQYQYLAYNYTKINDIEMGLYYHKKSAEIILKKGEKNQFGIFFGNSGNLFYDIEDFKKAQEYFTNALSIWMEFYGTITPYTINLYELVGKTYIKLGKYELAEANLKKALSLLDKKLTGNYDNYYHNYLIDIYIDFIALYNQKIDSKEALSLINKVIKINKNISRLYDYKNSQLTLKILSLKGKVKKKVYLKNMSLDTLKKSIEIYNETDKIIDNLRSSYKNHEDELEFSKTTQSIYSDAVKARLLIYKEINDIIHLEKAFYYSEKNKASILSQSLSTSSSFSGLSDSLVNLENTLKSRRSYYQSQITNELDKKEVDSTTLVSFEDKLFEVNRRYDSLTEVLEKDYPKYHKLKYDHSVISVSEVQKRLDDKTTLLEYFTADTLTYAFVISKNTFNVKELVTDSLLSKIEQQREALGQKDLVSYKKVSRSSYQELIDPISDLLVGENLIVVPDGPLWHLNFDLLLSEDSDSRNPQELPYLLKKYVISYANSANLLFNRPDFSQSKVLNQALAFSYADTTALVNGNVMRLGALRDAGEDLPGTRKEIKAISNIVDGVYYYGKEAVEANFKKDAEKYSIVHLALHGEVDNENPQNSKLYFTKSNDTIEDNLLYSHELFALNIPAELTVLSACNTGTGKIAKGEGIMSLGNAFQYAGTKSLLLSSWEVADDTAPELMKYFYSNLKKGMSKPKALQQAKLEYLNTVDPARSNPFYWGNFYLVGDPTPIKLDSNSSYWYWILGAIALIGGGGSVFYRKKRIVA